MIDLIKIFFPNLFGFQFGGGDSGGGGQAQPVASVPQPPTYAQTIQDYVDNYPKLFNLQKEYGPQEARLGIDLLNQYGPELTQYYTDQQKELTPYTYGLQEQLAQIASEGSQAGIPDRLKSGYLDQYRAEIGPNAGSPIGADYVSNNLARTSEDYNRYYQGLGLSLINKIPVQANSAATPQFGNTAGGLQGALGYNSANYGNYAQAFTNQPYIQDTAGRGGVDFGGLLGSVGSIGKSFMNQGGY